MKTTEILFLSLLLASYSLSEELMLYENDGKANSAFCLECDVAKEYECVPVDDDRIFIKRYECPSGKNIKKEMILRNVKIELENIVKEFKYVSDKKIRTKSKLENEVNNIFLNDINKMTLVNKNVIVGFCYKVNIYDNENLIVFFETDGNFFYDKRNKLMYKLEEYKPEKNLLRKYWKIYEENRCR